MIFNKQNKLAYLLIPTLCISLVNCSMTQKGTLSKFNSALPIDSASNHEVMLENFESGLILDLSLNNVETHIIKKTKNKPTDKDQHALKVNLLAKNNYKSSFTFSPKKYWDWSNQGNFSVAIDITNPMAKSTHLFTEVADDENQLHNRSVIIPKQSSKTYYIELKGHDLVTESGIRSNPPPWTSTHQPFIWRWGVKSINVNAIKHIKFSVASLLEDKALIIDNIRLVKSPEISTQYLSHLVDEYGQRNGIQYPNKVNSTHELIVRSQAELSQLNGLLMSDRSSFGGWKNGPKLKSTGYFRTEKYNGKWALVDPEGYLFFSTGIANVRMANTSTMTGVDFSSPLIKQRELNDHTPEDSMGLNTIIGEALSSKYIASDLRNNMFSWLPEYDEPLAKHYGYRRSVHSGALKKGETYSFYQANLERKYGDDYIAQWRDVTVSRMRNWGFTSFGNWIDPMFYHLNKVPYFANGWIIGDYKEVSSGDDYWSPLPDPFDPKFVVRAKATVKIIANEVKNNPWCIGVFIDNEKSWGRTSSTESHYGVVIHTLNRDITESPTKAVFSQLMKKKYKNISSLNHSWKAHINSWATFDKGVKLSTFTESQLADYSTMLKTYASEYFRVVKHELKKVLPNHLYMGARFADWGMTPEIVEAAANYVDVVSYNFYKEGLQNDYWSFLEEVDMPSIIGEFHMGATDTGLLNPGLVHAETQKDRSQMYTDYMSTVIDNPYFVGAHWFQYTDSPLTGRAYDGENYNVGFVSVTDSPYQEMINAVKAFNSNLYIKKFGSKE